MRLSAAATTAVLAMTTGSVVAPALTATAGAPAPGISQTATTAEQTVLASRTVGKRTHRSTAQRKKAQRKKAQRKRALRKAAQRRKWCRKHPRACKRARVGQGGGGLVQVGLAGRWGGAVPTENLGAVNAAYWNDYASGISTRMGYTGNDATCQAGTTSVAAQVAQLRALNFVRSLSGLTPVRFDAGMNAAAQQTALMMSANGALDHHPGSNWRCYSQSGATTAARSNLALSYPAITAAGAIGLYMSEPGGNNTAVGHRRWLMNPAATVMGTGSTNTANAITVMGPTSTATANPSWVSWPTPNYFPAPLEPAGRWSLSAGDPQVSFAGASVRVYSGGTLLNTTKQPVASGYARPTIVWQMPAVNPSGNYQVVVSGIKSGTNTLQYSYGVQLFTPTR